MPENPLKADRKTHKKDPILNTVYTALQQEWPTIITEEFKP